MAEGSEKKKAQTFLKDFTQHGPPTSVLGFIPLAINSIRALWSEDSSSNRVSRRQANVRIRAFGPEEVYKMDRIPRGPVLIINVKEVRGCAPREGTDLDRDALVNMFTDFNFGQITVYNDSDGLTAQDIMDKVDHFLRNIESNVQACVMCFLSHGSDGKFAGTDNRDVLISELEEKLCSCQSVFNKPKMMLFQACRGGNTEEPVLQADKTKSSNPRMNADLIICYPTAKGYVAYRDPGRGSLYITTLVTVFQEKAKTMCLHDMIIEVHKRLTEITVPTVNARASIQTPGIYHSMRKHWYLTSPDNQNV